VVQTATLLVLEPIFEADFQECSHGFRPQRNAHDAIRAVEAALRSGRSAVIDADLQSCFDTIPHDKLMKCLSHRIADRSVLGLIGMWLNAPVAEPPSRECKSARRFRSGSGTPQGGVISPLLANVYLNWMDVLFHRSTGPGVFARAKLVRYADDFVILARVVKEEVKDWLSYWIEERMGLRLNPDKTRVLRIASEGDDLDFLGYSFKWRKSRWGRGYYLHVGPSRKAMKRARAKIRERTTRTLNCLPIPQVVNSVNSFMRGWSGYFSLGYCTEAYSDLNAYSVYRLYRHLYRRSQRPYRPPAGMTWPAHLRNDLGLHVLCATGNRRAVS
jgi:RNA-directed DNA polymerase